MPFFLYRLDGTDYVRARSYVPLAGVNGPLCAVARRSPDVSEWELSEKDLLEFYNVVPDEHAFVIDLKPGIEILSLYRIKHVWGYVRPKPKRQGRGKRPGHQKDSRVSKVQKTA